MKIWLDVDNGPHVLIIHPLAAELQRRGHEISVTARDRASSCELLQLYGIPYQTVGAEYGASIMDKIRGTVGRSLALSGAMRGWKADVSFGHGSRALPLASRLLGVPTVTMYDYEWVDPKLFAWFCHTILLPDSIDPERCREAGIPDRRVRRFPGVKEGLYLDGRPLDPEFIKTDLDLDPDMIHVLMRPPATNAHYHNPEAEVLLETLLGHLAAHPEVQLVYLCRSEDQMALLGSFPRDRVVVPRRVYDGPSLVAAMDLMISGGGTMTREAAVLGVPSYSFFRGKLGRVDEQLEKDGKLVMLRSKDDAAGKVPLTRRSSALSVPDSQPLIASICDAIEAAAS